MAPVNLRSTASGQRLLAIYAKALGDPIRLQLVDVLAAHPGELCACELLPLFDIAQSTLSHHLKTLADAGILEIRRQGLFVMTSCVRRRWPSCRAGWSAPRHRRVAS